MIKERKPRPQLRSRQQTGNERTSTGAPPPHRARAAARSRKGTEITRLRLSAVVSVILHSATLAGLLLVAHYRVPVLPVPDKEAQVELLMIEQKGAGATSMPPTAAPDQKAPVAAQASAPPPPSTLDKSETAAPRPLPDAEAADALPTPPVPPEQPPAAAQPGSVPAPPEPPAPPAPVAAAARAPPPAPLAPPAITFNLGGTDSESNAIASGADIIPASPDSRHHNRPPAYPDDAAFRGEQGAVTLLIRVSPDGTPAGVFVTESSGYASLDRAAIKAVREWRFVPAIKDGQAVPFDMPMRFEFTF